jgi:hypothetical protein
MKPLMPRFRAIQQKAAYGLQVIESDNELNKGIRGYLHITDKVSKDKVEKQPSYPKQFSLLNRVPRKQPQYGKYIFCKKA